MKTRQHHPATTVVREYLVSRKPANTVMHVTSRKTTAVANVPASSDLDDLIVVRAAKWVWKRITRSAAVLRFMAEGHTIFTLKTLNKYIAKHHTFGWGLMTMFGSVAPMIMLIESFKSDTNFLDLASRLWPITVVYLLVSWPFWLHAMITAVIIVFELVYLLYRGIAPLFSFVRAMFSPAGKDKYPYYY